MKPFIIGSISLLSLVIIFVCFLMTFYCRFQRSIANKFPRRLRSQCQEQNARKFLTNAVKTSLSMFHAKNAKSFPRQSALKILSTWRRRSPRRSVSPSPRRCATLSPGSSWRRCQRRLVRRCVTAPRWTMVTTPAPIMNPPITPSPATPVVQITKNPPTPTLHLLNSQVVTKLHQLTTKPPLHQAHTVLLMSTELHSLLQCLQLTLTVINILNEDFIPIMMHWPFPGTQAANNYGYKRLASQR